MEGSVEMEARKLGLTVAASAVLLAGIGVAGASADTAPVPPVPAAVPAGVSDEEIAADQVLGASVEVTQEVESEAPDDEAGDQQGPSDVSEEDGDNNQDGAQSSDTESQGPSDVNEEEGDNNQDGAQSSDTQSSDTQSSDTQSSDTQSSPGSPPASF